MGSAKGRFVIAGEKGLLGKAQRTLYMVEVP